MGWKTKKPKATFFVWTRIPEGETNSMDFVKKLIDAGVILTPGNGFGKHGEGFVRFALTQPVDKIEEALERINNTLNEAEARAFESLAKYKFQMFGYWASAHQHLARTVSRNHNTPFAELIDMAKTKGDHK